MASAYALLTSICRRRSPPNLPEKKPTSDYQQPIIPLSERNFGREIRFFTPVEGIKPATALKRCDVPEE